MLKAFQKKGDRPIFRGRKLLMMSKARMAENLPVLVFPHPASMTHNGKESLRSTPAPLRSVPSPRPRHIHCVVQLTARVHDIGVVMGGARESRFVCLPAWLSLARSRPHSSSVCRRRRIRRVVRDPGTGRGVPLSRVCHRETGSVLRRSTAGLRIGGAVPGSQSGRLCPWDRFAPSPPSLVCSRSSH